jgi:16S rRNA (cytosine967-C5)-methyltransferase
VVSPARAVAFRILTAVEEGGYASDLLLAHTEALDSRDAGLASEIVFGCLRRQAQLDHLIALGTRGRLDRAVRIALRMGLYQKFWLDRVPDHAAVGESVELVKRARKASASGLVNAVLRRARLVEWPSREVALSMPQWLLAGWDREFGIDTASGIAAAFLHPPETFVRNPPADRTDLVLEPADVPGAYKVIAGDTEGLRIQDVGSQSIVPMLDLRPGLTFLDLCAAPGNKTAQALESGVSGIACDVHLHRLRSVQGCSRVVLDGTQPLPFRTRFDRILIDAPCSGTGTLGRNPEIRWRLQPSDIEDLRRKQVGILREGLRHLKPGGLLVYSTCSLERRENEDVVAESGADVVGMKRRTPGLDPGDGFFAALLRLQDCATPAA